MFNSDRNNRDTDYLSNISKITSIHPIVEQKYNENVPWLGRKLLGTKLIGDKNKIRLVRLVKPEDAEMLEKGIHYVKTADELADKSIENAHQYSNKYLQSVNRNPESQKAYNEYWLHTNLGGKTRRKKSHKKRRFRKSRKNRK